MKAIAMDTSIPVEDLLAGEKIPVGVGEIDKELVTLWQATANAPAEEARVAVTLIRVLNLLTYVEGEARADEVNDEIRRITGRHPCRSILLICTGDADAPSSMNAWVSAHCHLTSESGKQICSEQISIAAAGAAVNTMHSLALQLLISDTPVFLWWTASQPFDDPVLAHLADHIDRLVVDSAVFKDPVGSLLKMAGMGEVARPSVLRRAISDFNWTRLTTWRESTAQFFDLPAYQRYMNGISGVEVEYAVAPGDQPNPVQALLYVGWLASRLDWKFEGAEQGNDNSTFDLHLLHESHTVNVRIKPVEAQPDTAPSGGISEALLIATRPGQAQFRISRNMEAQCATTTVSLGGVEPTVRTMIYVEPDEGELLNQELEMFDHDLVFEQALHMAALFARGSVPAQRWSIVA
jgi:glucose-6-phosphate dehydrogenase assembly protein OpcA